MAELYYCLYVNQVTFMILSYKLWPSTVFYIFDQTRSIVLKSGSLRLSLPRLNCLHISGVVALVDILYKALRSAGGIRRPLRLLRKEK